MHIVECYFESGGFDFKLLRGGISVYMWNLAKQFVAAGHRVSIVTATNGRLDYLRGQYPIEKLDYLDRYELPLRLDPGVWKAQAEHDIALTTEAYRLHLDGIDIYFLDNAMLRLYPQTCYPPYESKGSEIGFHKPLAFQVDCIRFIRQQFGAETIVIHAHEPYYQYLLPLAFRDDPGKVVVSTVQSNMPVNKKVYKPKVRRLLELLDVSADLDAFDDRLPDDGLLQCIEQQMPSTHLHYAYPENYLNLLAPILEYSDHIDFLSPGQMDFYSSFADTPFEQLFQQLTIAEVIARNRHKFFVGWCAISDRWHQFDAGSVDRAAVLQGLGLNPDWPTFFHNARYAVEHKGQVELMRAIEAVLTVDPKVNFIVRCISGIGIDDPYFHHVQARFPANVHLDWAMVSEERLMELASAADFGLFPSKFEMDTFLIAQGESMLCGTVPIATLQEGTRHFEHGRPLSDPLATGLAVNRSFAENDNRLVQALSERIIEAIALYRDQPATYQRLARNAHQCASQFNWSMAAQAHLQAFGRGKAATAAPAITTPAPQTSEQARAAFEAAYTKADFERCAALNRELRSPHLARRLAERVSLRHADAQGPDVEYRFAEAVAIDLFTRPALGETRFVAYAMTPTAEGFRCQLPVPPADRELYCRLTLRSGRVCWDRIAHA